MRELNSLWLKSFTILCEERHFTKAAERLNMTQPGMSQHIAKLEQQLGVPLVERNAPGFILTEAGEKTLAMARTRWREERNFRETLDDEDENRGKVSVASSGSFAMLLYPALIDWMAEAPNISAILTAAPEESIVSGVLLGSFDVGVAANSPRHPGLSAEYLGTEPLDLILPPHWAGRLPSFEDLQSLGFIQHPDGTSYADTVLGSNFASEYRGAERLHVRSFVNQIGQIPEPVARGLGYSILPRSGVLAYPMRDAISIVQFPRPSLLQLHLVQLSRRSRSPRTEKLVGLVRREAAKLNA